MTRPRATVGDRVQMRRGMLMPGEADPFDPAAMLGTVTRLTGNRQHPQARVQWDSGSSKVHALGMLRVLAADEVAS